MKSLLIPVLLGLFILTSCDSSQELTVMGMISGFEDSAVFFRAPQRVQLDRSLSIGFKIVGPLPGTNDIVGVAVKCVFDRSTTDYLRRNPAKDVIFSGTVPNRPGSTWQPGLKYTLYEAQNCKLLKVQESILMNRWIDPPIGSRNKGK